MSKIDKIYVRRTRDELGRYPNWPLNQGIALGSIGHFHGRKAKFEWRTSLKELGIDISEVAPQAFMSELYTSHDSVSSEFHAASGDNPSKAEFNFAKTSSVASQGFEMGHQQLPIDRLKNEIIKSINKGVEWDYTWVVITELWLASGFTTLISSSKNSSSVIAANKVSDTKVFNIADINLGLQVTRSKFMAYQGVAEQNVRPYFQIHRLTKDHRFKLYGVGTYFWNN